MHAVHGEIVSICKDRAQRGVATHHVAVQLLDFQPLLWGLPNEVAGQTSGTQAAAQYPNGRSCTFLDDPTRLRTLLGQAWPHQVAHMCTHAPKSLPHARTILAVMKAA